MLSENEVEEIVEKTVNQTLTQLGFDVSNPLETQKDQAWVRGWRRAVTGGAWAGLLAFIGIAVPGTVIALWQLLRQR